MTAFFRFFASIRLAVIIIISLAVVAAIGTLTEAKYNDSEAAQVLVYRSPYMYAVLGLLVINLMAVMIDRWPWKWRHTPFILAHIGIIMMLFGAWVTQKQGVDGTLVFEPGQSQRYITVKNRDLAVYATMNGDDVRPVFQQEVDFLSRPAKEYPLKIQVGSDVLEVVNSYQYAFRQSEISPSDRAVDGPAVRFQLENDRVNLSEWLKRESHKSFNSINLGPAQVILSDGSYKPASDKNEIVMSPGPSSDSIRYSIYSHGLLSKRGVMKQGEVVDTGWMGLKFHVLRFLPKARENVTYTPADHNTDQTQSAIEIRFHGESHWVGLNSLLRIYSNDRMYIISYGHRRIPLDFSLTLKDFRVGHYQGTQRAASYESDVEVPGRGLVTISMNEPLKFGGYTFYQASFEQDDMGKPTASVLSVNYDPGRWIKYIGSMTIVLGAICLFWFRNYFHKRKA
jgi:hypothetical protein